MKKTPSNEVLVGDCREVMKTLPENYISACITDPPFDTPGPEGVGIL
jgi:site-specific DNA-methyltransferase (adenine-specific)